jgi:cytochrome o ubiquinol oxidase subunit 2
LPDLPRAWAWLRQAKRVAAPALSVLLGGCAALDLGIVNHAGPVAAEQWRLYLIVAAVLVFVAAPVLILVPLIAWHYRLSNKGDAYRPDWGFSWPLEILVWVPPIGIVIGLGVLLWSSTHRLDPYRPLASPLPPVEVQAVALDWKWLFIYPADGVATVNRLVIPADRPVHLSLTSGTVMQSLLVPQLAGQIYAMAGMRTQLNLAASRTGVFRGENTQFNGADFHAQKFDVVALTPADYRRWLARLRSGGRPLDARALARITDRSIVARPVGYAGVPDRLFERIMTDSTRDAT